MFGSVTSVSSLLNIFKSGTSADDLLKSTKIIKRMIIGISYLDNKNPNSLLRTIFGDEVSHSSIFFSMEEKNTKNGILVQYGKYEYIKNKKDILGQDAKSIGYPYKEKGGLIFGEIEFNIFKKEYKSMSYNLDLVIKSLQTELKTRGIELNNTNGAKINNYIKDITEKSQIINRGIAANIKDMNQNNLLKSQSFLRNRNEERQIKEYIEVCLYNMMTPLKVELKSSLENINLKMNNFEKELLKINLLNENIRTFTSKLSKLENDYNLLNKNLLLTNSLSAKNRANFENLDTNFKTLINDTNKSIFQLKDEINKVSNTQRNFDNNINFDNYNNNNVSNEKKIIDKINILYKQKESNLNILSTNLFSKFNEYSKQTDDKLEILNNSINEIKKRINSADNNVNLLNDIPNIKVITMNNNKEIESMKSKIETISNAADIKNCKEEMENTKNDIQIIKTDIEEINKLKNENKKLNNEFNEMKNNVRLLEKKFNNMEGNFFNLDNEINDNKKEIIRIKKEKNDFKSQNNFASINDDNMINDKLNKLNEIISENNKTINNLELYWKNKIKEQSRVYNENFHNINERMELFNNEEIKLNEENSKLINILGKSIIDNNNQIKNIIESDIKLIYLNLL